MNASEMAFVVVATKIKFNNLKTQLGLDDLMEVEFRIYTLKNLEKFWQKSFLS